MTTTPARGVPARAVPAPARPPSRAPVAWVPVLGVAAAVAVVLGVLSGRYGWFGDELYFLSAGARPALGYADQPPLLPLLAAAMDALAPGDLVAFRLPATLLTAAGTVVAALLAAEFGGGRWAQVTAAVATGISPYLLATGHLLATSTVDPFLWSVALLLLARWLRLEATPDDDPAGPARDRLLLGFGGVAALALLTKLLIPVLLAGVALGIVVAGPRRLLTRPMLWSGAAVAGAATVPTILWQAAHGWPQASMGAVVSGEAHLFGDRWEFLPRACYYAGLVPGVVLVPVGVWALLRLPAFRPWRALGIAVVVVVVVLLAAGGRPYYPSGLYALVFAAGATALARGRGPAGRALVGQRWWGILLHPVVIAAAALATVVWVLPVGPAARRAPVDFESAGQLGWPQLADGVAARYRALPPEVRARTVVVAYSYWYAAGLERYGPERGLPVPVYSTHRGFGYFAPPPDGSLALLVGEPPWAARFCTREGLRPLVGTGVVTATGTVRLSLCTPSAPWSAAWPSLRNLA